jgi:effector-binding domain-containing protein
VIKKGKSEGKVSALSYGEMKVVQAVHTGSYETLPASYARIGTYLEENSLEASGQVFEFYLTDPTQEPDTSKWKTIISFLLN